MYEHPTALPHAEKPAWLPKSFTATQCIVTLPRLGSHFPIPLLGLITAWDTAHFKTAARVISTSLFRVPAWVVPSEMSLFPLRKLL